jgi:hypothetical protein
MMNIENSWYVIECNQRYEILPHAELQHLPVDSYVVRLNVPTRRDAVYEMARLIKIENEEIMQKFKQMKNRDE